MSGGFEVILPVQDVLEDRRRPAGSVRPVHMAGRAQHISREDPHVMLEEHISSGEFVAANWSRAAVHWWIILPLEAWPERRYLVHP
jgi:hypothetical protein